MITLLHNIVLFTDNDNRKISNEQKRRVHCMYRIIQNIRSHFRFSADILSHFHFSSHILSHFHFSSHIWSYFRFSFHSIVIKYRFNFSYLLWIVALLFLIFLLPIFFVVSINKSRNDEVLAARISCESLYFYFNFSFTYFFHVVLIKVGMTKF